MACPEAIADLKTGTIPFLIACREFEASRRNFPFLHAAASIARSVNYTFEDDFEAK